MNDYVRGSPRETSRRDSSSSVVSEIESPTYDSHWTSPRRKRGIYTSSSDIPYENDIGSSSTSQVSDYRPESLRPSIRRTTLDNHGVSAPSSVFSGSASRASGDFVTPDENPPDRVHVHGGVNIEDPTPPATSPASRQSSISDLNRRGANGANGFLTSGARHDRTSSASPDTDFINPYGQSTFAITFVLKYKQLLTHQQGRTEVMLRNSS